MMEWNDKEFDAAFRNKVSDADPQFEEAAWDMMERKLRKRDRVIFLRKSAVVCAVLLAAFVGLFMYRGEVVKPRGGSNNAGVVNPVPAPRPVPVPLVAAADSLERERVLTQFQKGSIALGNGVRRNNWSDVTIAPSVESAESVAINIEQNAPLKDEIVIEQGIVSNKPAESPVSAGQDIQEDITKASTPKLSVKRALPMSFSISAGPEFNSASSIIGGDPGFTAGLAFGVGLTKSLSMRTGIEYSQKGYKTDNYAYKFNNDRVQGVISGVDATCAVLELPLVVSYRLSENFKRSLDLNAGISSYFMLKEDYVFRYTAQSGIPDRIVERRNANQHYLSVVNLSATYFIKLKKNKMQLGLEPYVKIPLTGVGEGKVNLKSSGISLRLRYDINKKNN